MVATMARKTKKVEESVESAEWTTIKIRKTTARKISQLAALIDKSIPDTVDRYGQQIEDDLLNELAKRQAELARK